MARLFIHLRAGQGAPLLQARKGEVNSISSWSSRLMRLLPRLIALAAIFSLAMFAARSYSQNINSAPHQPHPRLKPASSPHNSLTIANLAHAAVLMNHFGTRV